jgi:uncharacterized protein (TIGR03435 family)
MRSVIAVVVAAFLGGVVLAQTPPGEASADKPTASEATAARPTSAEATVGRPTSAEATVGRQFEVASVKPAAPPAPVSGFSFARLPPDQWRAGNLTLLELIESTHAEYRFPGLISGGPAWIRESHFDIDARKDPKATPEEIRQMVDNLLADRFKLRTHLEPRMMNVYLLTLARADGKLGPTIAPSAPQCVEARTEQRPIASWPEECRTSRFPRPTGPGSFVNLTANEIRDLLASFGRMRDIDRPVLDRTGLTGHFDAALHWNQPPNGATNGAETVSLFTALQEQLGLKLEPAREMVNVLVIDQAQPPAEN